MASVLCYISRRSTGTSCNPSPLNDVMYDEVGTNRMTNDVTEMDQNVAYGIASVAMKMDDNKA